MARRDAGAPVAAGIGGSIGRAFARPAGSVEDIVDPGSSRLSRWRSLRFGLGLPWRALGIVVRDPWMVALSLLPVAVTTLLYIFVIGGMTAAIQGAILGSAVAWGLTPGGWALAAVAFVTNVALLVVGALTFSFTAAAVASPFNDALALRAERHATPPLPPPGPQGWKRHVELIALDIVRNVLAATAAVAALVLWWLPFVNGFWLVLAFALVAFQYVSYPQNRRGIGLRDGLRFVWRFRWACTGLGATLTVLFALPLVSALVLPLAVVAGTLLVGRAQPFESRPMLR